MKDAYLHFLERPTRERYTHFVIVYLPVLERFVRRLIASEDLADDIVQETFLVLGRKKAVPEKIRQPRSYVLGVAFHLAQRQASKAQARARHEKTAGQQRPVACPPAPDAAAASETVLKLHEAINSLPRPLRAAMHLHAVEGLTYQEIASVTGCSPKAVSMQLSRARKLLRTELGEATFALALGALGDKGPNAWFLPPTKLSRDVAARFSAGLRLSNKSSTGSMAPIAIGTGIISLGVLIFCIHGAGAFLGSRSGEESNLADGISSPRVVDPTAAIDSLEPPLIDTVFDLSRTNGDFVVSPGLPSTADESVVENHRSQEPLTQEGDDPMRFKALTLASVLIALRNPVLGQGGEPGDFDGDGLITLRDAIVLQDHLFQDEGAFAPDSLEPFKDYPCYSVEDRWGSTDYIGASVFLESIRRSVPGSFPTWSFSHWPESWLEEHPQEPMPVDGRMRVRILDVKPDGSDHLNLELLIELSAPVKGFVLILEGAEEVLRVPWLTPHHPGLGSPWRVTDFGRLTFLNRIPQGEQGDLTVRAPEMGYLISGGKFVITRGLEGIHGRLPNVPAGEHTVLVRARIALGSRMGTYPLRLSPASQVLFEDGTLAQPEQASAGSIEIAEEVPFGWDGSIPPLDIDVKNQKVIGRVDFRIVDQNGSPASPGQPLLTVAPGESFTIRVQARTETPLNKLHFELGWPLDVFNCWEDDAFAIYEDERNSEPYKPGMGRGQYCNFGHHSGPARFGAWFFTGANWSPMGNGKDWTSNYDRPMDYFEPLQEWLNLYEITLSVPPATPTQLVPLRFRPSDPHNQTDSRFAEPSAEFAPYRAWFYCQDSYSDERALEWPREGLWKYDVHYEDTSILIGGGETQPHLDLGIRIVLGETEGAPGELVEVPILASAAQDLWLLGVAFSLDPLQAQLEAVRTHLTSQRPRDFWSTFEPSRGPHSELDCLTPEECGDRKPGECCISTLPFHTMIRQGEGGWNIEWDGRVGSDWPAYPGADLYEVARLVVRIAADRKPGDEILMQPATVLIDHYGFPTEFRSGGSVDALDRENPFSPATEVRRGRITVVEPTDRFVRGDANADANVDLSDAVSTLGYLFLGNGAPACLDAADTDDSGKVEITDAIFLLGALFLGTNTIPAPYPSCGLDPTAQDELGCGQACR
jgi:RNA polymerase sigma-70 factor (ECF subfamily)